jgi:hypothetical protein
MSKASGDVIKGNWTNESAFNLQLATQEAKAWIEAVVQEKFFYPDNFQASLKNGILLCKLINQIKPNSVKKISESKSDMVTRENVALFIYACKALGLKDSQIFDVTDLVESKRLRNVAICLYWLGRAARAIPTYKGPQLNLLAFKKLNCTGCKKAIEGNQPYLATLDKQYHVACAKCSACHCKLDPKQPYYQNGDKIFCPNCMVSAASVNTNLGLNKGPAGGKAPGGGHGHGHGSDDLCAGCFIDMDGKDHVPEGDKKYCLACICDLCHNPLLGNFSVKNGKKYCDGCICFDCGVPLTDGFYEDGNLRFCEGCNTKKNNEKPILMPPTESTEESSHGHTHGPGCGHSHGPPKDKGASKPGCKVCDKPIGPKAQKPAAGDRDKFCTPHENEYCCGYCDKEMSGPVVEAGGKRYHPPCHDLMKKANNNNKHGNCAGCIKPITDDKAVDAMNKKWHPQCFKCTDCKSGFPDGNYVEGSDGKPYCNNCGGGDGSESSDITWGPNDKCGGCPKPLGGVVTKVMGKYWHQGCFKCTKCGTSFKASYLPFQDMPYCEPCHAEVSGADRCSKCKGVLEGELIKTHNMTWHKRCFVCTTCSKGLIKDDALVKFSKPYCRVCHSKVSMACAKCRNTITGEHSEVGGKTYCEKCAPVTTSTVYGNDKKQGFMIDPRSGKKTFT